MAYNPITYARVHPTIVSATTGGGNQAGTNIPGTTRWNQTTGKLEIFDGYQWLAMSAGEIKGVTLSDMVTNAEDQLWAAIEEGFPNNVTIQDAFKAWEEANERFKVILALAEGNK